MLYIRSQNKKRLEPFTGFIIEDKRINFADSCFHLAGEYKSEERCLEILDEITKLLTPQLKITFNQNKVNTDTELKHLLMQKSNTLSVLPDIQPLISNTDFVYEMPEE